MSMATKKLHDGMKGSSLKKETCLLELHQVSLAAEAPASGVEKVRSTTRSASMAMNYLFAMND
jgi:hypothetical protein